MVAEWLRVLQQPGGAKHTHETLGNAWRYCRSCTVPRLTRRLVYHRPGIANRWWRCDEVMFHVEHYSITSNTPSFIASVIFAMSGANTRSFSSFGTLARTRSNAC